MISALNSRPRTERDFAVVSLIACAGQFDVLRSFGNSRLSASETREPSKQLKTLPNMKIPPNYQPNDVLISATNATDDVLLKTGRPRKPEGPRARNSHSTGFANARFGRTATASQVVMIVQQPHAVLDHGGRFLSGRKAAHLTNGSAQREAAIGYLRGSSCCRFYKKRGSFCF